MSLGGRIYSVGNPRAPTKDPTRTNPAIDSASTVTDLKSATLDRFDDVQVLLSVDLAQQSEIHHTRKIAAALRAVVSGHECHSAQAEIRA